MKNYVRPEVYVALALSRSVACAARAVAVSPGRTPSTPAPWIAGKRSAELEAFHVWVRWLTSSGALHVDQFCRLRWTLG